MDAEIQKNFLFSKMYIYFLYCTIELAKLLSLCIPHFYDLGHLCTVYIVYISSAIVALP